MAAVPDFPARCVIWFGHPLTLERATLAAAGWQARGVAPDQCAGIGMPGTDPIAGLLDLPNAVPANRAPPPPSALRRSP